jgi:hypothetical protein
MKDARKRVAKFDPEERRREKQAQRERDLAAVQRAQHDGSTVCIRNGVFTALDIRKARIEYPASGQKH